MALGGVVGGDAPEVEEFLTFLFGVEDSGGEHAVGGGEVFVVHVGGGLHVKARGVFKVVEEEGSSDDAVFLWAGF